MRSWVLAQMERANPWYHARSCPPTGDAIAVLNAPMSSNTISLPTMQVPDDRRIPLGGYTSSDSR